MISQFLPSERLHTGSLQDVRPKRDNQSALFRNGNELQRRNYAHCWMRPSSECFKTDELICQDVELRLVMNGQIAVRQGAPQFIFKGEALEHRGAELLAEEDNLVCPSPFCYIHCAVRLLQQVIIGHPMFWKDADSNAGADGSLTTLNEEGFAERIKQVPGCFFGVFF